MVTVIGDLTEQSIVSSMAEMSLQERLVSGGLVAHVGDLCITSLQLK